MLNEASLLVNNEVEVTSPRSQFRGEVGTVRKVMADNRTLEIEFPRLWLVAFLDFTFVREIQERIPLAKGEANLGPIANSVIKDTI